MESASTESQGIMTSKLFDYLMAAKPILLSGVSETSELSSFIDRNGLLLHLDDLDQLISKSFSGDFPKVSPFNQAIESRQRLLKLLDSLESSID